MSRLLRTRYLVVLLAAVLVVALGVGVGVLLKPKSTPQGKLLVLLTVDAPLAQHATSQEERAVGLRLLPSGKGSNWLSVPVPTTRVALPGNWTAPNSDSLFLATVPAQEYRAAELELQGSSGSRLDDSQTLLMKVAKTGLTPLLFTFRVSQTNPAGSASAVAAAAAYGGNDEVNFGLEVAQGKVMSLPSVPLVNQAGQTVSLKQYRGKVLVVASFLTECQETCPLVAAALLQLQHLLNQQHLQNQVQIVEVSQDPGDDTPAILTKYQKYFSLPWPLLTGTSVNVSQFWSQLKVPPVQAQAWDGPAPIDMFTGQKEPFNLIHASVVDVVNPQGYVVSELEDQPTLSASTIPQVIYKYLDAQGQQEEKAGGSWTPESLLGEVTPILERNGTYTKLPNTKGAVTVGKPAPDFSLASSAGDSVALSQEAGHPVLIDFWATWCTNCQADMKLVAQTAQQYRSQGLRVLLVDFEENRATAVKFLKGLDIDLPTLLDRNGQVAQDYGVPGLPVAVFINGSGTVTAIQVGQLDQAEVDHDVPSALGK
ncbi:MAG: redoxin domain-containing protein [Candidatus Dormiibacterota bacterium]